MTLKKVALASALVFLLASPFLFSTIKTEISSLAAAVGASYITGPSYIQADIGGYGQGQAGSYINNSYDWYSYTNCPKVSLPLKRGSRDSTTQGQVSNLQQYLANRYVIDPLVLVSGSFGALTERYLIQFQRDSGVDPSGIVDAKTLDAILVACGAKQAGARIATTTQNQGFLAHPTCAISIIPTSVYVGQIYTVYWYSQNSTNAYLSEFGPVPTSGSRYKQNTTTGTAQYSLSVSGPGGSASCQTAVTIGKR